METWRAVVGFEDTYAVSNHGRVMRTKASTGTRPGKVLRPGKTRYGTHLLVILRQDGRAFTRSVHRLVAEAFIPRPVNPRAYMVAHRDGNGLNNRDTNLYWATPSENARDQVLHGTAKGAYDPQREALPDADVLAIRADHRTARLIGKDYKIHPSTVTQIRRRETHKHLKPRENDYVQTLKKFNFTPEQIREIRAEPRSDADMARDLGVSHPTVWAIRRRKSYAWVD